VSDRPYSRLYHELAEEYTEVYDSPLLADYMRLLVAADQSYPVRARWTGLTTKRGLQRLESCGLVEVDGTRYSVKGMEKERATRAERARRAAYARHGPSSARSSASGSASSSASGSANADTPSLPRRDETRRDEQSKGGEQGGEQGESAIDAYYRLTTKPPSRTVIAWLDRLIAEHDEREVVRVMADEWRRDPNPADFLGRVQTRLASLASKAARQADDQRRRSAIDDQRELEKRLAAMSPEERARTEQRAAELRDSIGALVRGMP